jgi:hypothetical protein
VWNPPRFSSAPFAAAYLKLRAISEWAGDCSIEAI